MWLDRGASVGQFATLLEAHTSSLVERWATGFREGLPPYSARLQAQLGQVLRALILSLQEGKVGVPDTSSGPFVFDLQGLVREYGLLSTTLLGLAEKTGTAISLTEMHVFSDFMCTLVADGVASHCRLHEDLGRAREAAAHHSRSEHQRAETQKDRLHARALSERDATLVQTLFMQAPALMCVVEGPELAVTFANAAWLVSMGTDTLEGTLSSAVRAVMTSGEPYAVNEQPVALERGETVHLNLVYQPRRNVQGQVTGVLVMGSEVSAQVRARARWARESAAVRRSEEHLRRVLEVAVAGTWEFDVTADTVSADGAMRTLHGYPAEGVLSVEAALSALHPEDARKLREAIEGALAPLGSRTFQLEYRATDATGRSRWLEARGRAVFDASGTGHLVLAASVDITSRKEAELQAQRALEQTAAEAQEHVEFERQLIGIVGHDLGNPIAAMKLGIGLLLRDEKLEPASHKVVTRLKTTLDGMMRQVNDLLDFTEARVGRGLTIVREPMDLHGVTQQVAEEVQMTFPSRELELEQEGDGEGSWDPQRIAQVALNLISNALKHSPPDTTVRVKTRAVGEWVEMQVSNQGRPIPPEVLPVLYEPMQRGVAAAEPLGRSVGLGLYVVKHIVDALGGTIAVTSNEHAGTAFTLRFPRASA